jgi:hypothetical protein
MGAALSGAFGAHWFATGAAFVASSVMHDPPR